MSEDVREARGGSGRRGLEPEQERHQRCQPAHRDGLYRSAAACYARYGEQRGVARASEAAPRRNLGRLVGRLVQVAIAALVAVLLWRAVASLSWRELGRTIAAADLRYTLLGVALLVGRYLVWTLRWRLALRTLEHLVPLPSWLHSFFTVVGAVAANGFTPTAPVVRRPAAGAPCGRGGRARLRARIRGRAVRPGGAPDGADAERCDGGDRAGALVRASRRSLRHWLRRWSAAPSPCRTGCAASTRRASSASAAGSRAGSRAATSRARARRDGCRRSIAHAREALRVVQRLLRERWLRRAALLLGVVFVALNSLALWAFFRALGRPVDPLTAWLAVTVGVAAGGFTGTPGGVGTTEAGMVLALGAMEVGELDAAAATLLYPRAALPVVLVLGVPALVLLEARLRRRAVAEEAA